MNTSGLIDQLATEGGVIVSSVDCSATEITNADATGRFAVREDGMGFVRRTKAWLELMHEKRQAELLNVAFHMRIRKLESAIRKIDPKHRILPENADVLLGFEPGDLVEATKDITARLDLPEVFCTAGTKLRVTGPSGNYLHPIRVQKDDDSSWACAVSASDIRKP